MSEKFNLILELQYIPPGSIVRRNLMHKKYRVTDEIMINVPDLKDLNIITASKNTRFIIPMDGGSVIESAGMEEKFILENLTKEEAIQMINKIDNEFRF